MNQSEPGREAGIERKKRGNWEEAGMSRDVNLYKIGRWDDGKAEDSLKNAIIEFL